MKKYLGKKLFNFFSSSKSSIDNGFFYSPMVNHDTKITVFNELFSPQQKPKFIASYKSTDCLSSEIRNFSIGNILQ